jgi:hypothetical protein
MYLKRKQNENEPLHEFTCKFRSPKESNNLLYRVSGLFLKRGSTQRKCKISAQ